MTTARARWSWLLACAVVAVVSCRFEPYTPPGRLRCTTNTQCPSGLKCTLYQGAMKLCCRNDYCEGDKDFVPPTGPTDGTPTPSSQCEVYADAYCSRVAACDTMLDTTSIRLQFGTVSRCRDRVQKSCVAKRALPGITWPSQACTNATRIQACSTFTNGGPEAPAECSEPGGGADGSSCSDELQCQGRRCVMAASGTGCSTCAHRAAAGEGCQANGDCAFGLRCASAKCVKPGESGATCDVAHPCRSTSVCKGGFCADLGAQGASCADDRECKLGFVCDMATHQCGKLTVSDKTCGGPYQACSSYGICDATLRKCQLPVNDGEACGLFAGCLWPAYCDGATCQLPAPDLTCAPTFSGATNNSAEIAGTAIGLGTAPNASRRKALQATFATPAPAGYELGGAFVFNSLDPVSLPDLTKWAVAITNRGEARCGIQAVFVVFRDAAGNILQTANNNRLLGSIGTQAGSDFFWLDDCLASGETGYLTGLQAMSFASVAQVQLMLEPGTPAAPAALRIIPESYVVTDRAVIVTVKNEGTVPVRIETPSTYVLSDAQGMVGWGVLSPDATVPSLNPGEITTLSDEALAEFAGQGDRLRVIVSLQRP